MLCFYEIFKQFLLKRNSFSTVAGVFGYFKRSDGCENMTIFSFHPLPHSIKLAVYSAENHCNLMDAVERLAKFYFNGYNVLSSN